MYYGQHQEDKYIDDYFGQNYKGVCVEVGAYDGVTASNTYYFEKKGWRALCIEPTEHKFNICKKYRKEAIQCCAGNDTKDSQFTIYHIHDNTGAISSLVPDDRLIASHKHLITGVTTQKIKVRTLTSILDEFNYPVNIDFISIDTENTELDVLKGLDLGKYQVKMFVVENNYNEPFCEEYLKKYGYEKINRIVVNDFYVKK
jgi:FkbM family methyltransferase